MTNLDAIPEESPDPFAPAGARVFTGAGARRAAVAWVIVGTMGLLGYRPIFYVISHAYVLLITLWATVGVVLMIRLGGRMNGPRTTLGTALAFSVVPLFLAVIVIVRDPIVNAGDRVFTRAYFALHHSHYDDVLAELDPSDPPCGTGWDRSCEASGGTVFRYDIGPPLRLVFPRGGGSADDWIGVVHDPSDEIAAASEREPVSYAGFESLARDCEPLGDHYFECRFRR